MITTEPRRLWHAWRSRADQDAFAALVRPEIRYASDLARRAGATPSEADDVVQDALVKLAHEPSDTPVEIGVRAWICRRVVLGLKMHIRSSVRRRRHEGHAPPPRRSEAPGAHLERKDQVEVALASIDERERRAVVLRFLHDLEYREMAYILGISENACRIRVHRALKSLREKLGKRAAALVAMLVIPPVATETALVGVATSAIGTAAGTAVATGTTTATASTAAAATVSTKTVVATGTGLVAATAIVVGVVAKKADPPPAEPPPAVVAEAPAPEPTPPPPPPPAPVPALPPPVAPVPIPTTPRAVVLLDGHFDGTKDASATVRDFDAALRAIGRPLGDTVTVKTTGAVTDLDLQTLSERYDRIVLDRGVFHVTRGIHAKDRGVIEIVGQGRDETFLLAPDRDVAYVPKGEAFAGLLVRDLTFDGDLPGDRQSGTLFDIKGRGAAAFERVHFRTWIWRAGYSAAVGCSGRALLAFRDCTFTGGYKRTPAGYAFSMRGDALFRFERCRFSDLDGAVSNVIQFSQHPRSIGHFEDCVFDNTPLVRKQGPDGTRRAPYTLHVHGGRVLLGLPRDTEARRFERWRGAAAASVEDVEWGDEPLRCTWVELRRVLEAYVPPPGRRVVAIEAYTWFGCDRTAYGIFLLDEQDAVETRLVRLEEGRLVRAERGGYLLGPRLLFHPGTGKTLEQLLAQGTPGLDPDQPVGALHLRRTTSGTPLLFVLDRLGKIVWRSR